MTKLSIVAAIAAVAALGCADETDRADLADTTSVSTTAAPTTTTAPPEVREPVTVSAEGENTSDPFTLAAGRYTVHYRYGGSCYYAPSIEALSGGVGDFYASGDGPVEGDTNLYEVQDGQYFVEMITGPSPGCPWMLTFTPVQG